MCVSVRTRTRASTDVQELPIAFCSCMVSLLPPLLLLLLLLLTLLLLLILILLC